MCVLYSMYTTTVHIKNSIKYCTLNVVHVIIHIDCSLAAASNDNLAFPTTISQHGLMYILTRHAIWKI